MANLIVPGPMRSVWIFFALALGWTWLLQLPALLATHGLLAGGASSYVPAAALGGFGPLLAAVVAARLEGPGAVASLFSSLRPRTTLVAWYAAALLAFPLIHVLGEAAYRIVAGQPAGAWLYPPVNAQQLAALVLIPIVEETGWRGFAMPRLVPRFGWLRASYIVGVAWAAWHAMMFLLQGFDAPSFVLGMLMIAAGSVIFGWLFYRTRGSLLVAVLAHAGVHLDNPTRALPNQLTAYAAFAAAVCLAALVLARLPRRKPGPSADPPSRRQRSPR